MFRLLLAIASLFAGQSLAQDFDVILVGGKIVDGAGNPWYRADIGIRGGRIAEIGRLAGRSAGRSIAVNGQVIAPGFIDMMGATTLPLLSDPTSGHSKLRQGITTMMAGEGGSEAPQNEFTMTGRTGAGEQRAVIQAGLSGRQALRWTTFGEYFTLLEKRGIPLNVVHNVGAAQVRRVVIGDEDRTPTPSQMEAMKRHVEQAMRDGAVGLSTALIYPPGTYAKTDELVEMVKVVAKYGGFYSTHMRNESSRLLEAIDESIEIGEKAGVPVHIYHLKAAGEENWPLMKKAIDMIARARERGLDVSADIYPYIRNGLGINSLIHPRHYAEGSQKLRQSLSDPAVRASLRKEIETTSDWENWYRHVGRNWDNILVAAASRKEDKRFEGRSVAEIARMRGVDEWTVFFDFVAAGGVSVNPKSMDEAQKHLALRTDFVSLCTDAAPTNIKTATGAHPRAFGSFPRVLNIYVRQQRVIPLESAIRKMTSLPANRLRLWDRGRIAPGMAADLVVFDPGKIDDVASFVKPLAYPTGISYVLVNGGIAVDNGESTAALKGSVLRGPGAARPSRAEP